LPTRVNAKGDVKMYVRVDLATVPPTVTLEETDDFTKLSVRVEPCSHAYVGAETLAGLAGHHASDPAWMSKLEGMFEFAGSNGWLQADGSIRAHIE
jgi:hypothetical protein